MRTISLWAFHHKWAARTAFIFIYVAFNVVCLFFSEVLNEQGIVLPVYLSYLLCIPFLIALFLYPSRKEKSNYKNFYLFQKSMDGILFITSFLLTICTLNRLANNNPSFNATGLYAAETAVKPIKPFSKIKVQSKKIAFIVKNWKTLKHNYSLLRQAYKNTSKGEKGLLIALAVIVALALVYLVLALSCALACSGAEGAALVLALLGTALIVLLLVKVIGSIRRGPRKKEKVKEAIETPSTT